METIFGIGRAARDAAGRADIDGEHQTGAVGEQHLGEATVEAPTSRQNMILDLDRILLPAPRELNAAARDKGCAGCACNAASAGIPRKPSIPSVIGHDQARFNRRLRACPASNRPRLDQQQVGALAGGGMRVSRLDKFQSGPRSMPFCGGGMAEG